MDEPIKWIEGYIVRLYLESLFLFRYQLAFLDDSLEILDWDSPVIHADWDNPVNWTQSPRPIVFQWALRRFSAIGILETILWGFLRSMRVFWSLFHMKIETFHWLISWANIIVINRWFVDLFDWDSSPVMLFVRDACEILKDAQECHSEL